MSSSRPGWPTQSQELLLKAALLDDERALAAWEQWREVDTLEQTDAQSRRLLPLLYRNLLAVGISDPELPKLKGIYRHSWVVNQHLLRHAASALRALHEAGLETLVLKGAALTLQHYRDVGARPMNDVDIMVRTERAEEAAEALTSSGWRQVTEVDTRVLVPVEAGTAFTGRGPGSIDLHWHALWSPAEEEHLWAAAVPFKVGGVQTMGPCPADQFLHACVHGLWSPEKSLHWVADAITLSGPMPGTIDWERVVDGARARSLTVPLNEALSYLRATFDAPIPCEVMKRIRERRPGWREQITHRAWMSSGSRLSIAWLLWERYRRHRLLSRHPDGADSFPSYLRRYGSMAWGVDRMRALLPAILVRMLRGSRMRT